MTVASGWKPAQAGTRRAPKAVPAIRSRRVIPDLARSDFLTEQTESVGNTATATGIKAEC